MVVGSAMLKWGLVLGVKKHLYIYKGYFSAICVPGDWVHSNLEHFRKLLNGLDVRSVLHVFIRVGFLLLLCMLVKVKRQFVVPQISESVNNPSC